MTIVDIIREKTFTIRDSLNKLETHIFESKSERDAAEERKKRASTEISQHRTKEREIKQLLDSISDKAKKTELRLEELERQRQETIDALIKDREEQSDKQKELKEAQNATERAHADIRKEEKAKQVAEELTLQRQSELQKKQIALREKLLEALETFLLNQSEQLQKAFLTEEQRIKEKQEIEEFHKARHSDPEIAGLCEQRDELKKLLDVAMVPKVKEALLSSLKEAEEHIKKRYPIAIRTGEGAPQDIRIEELLYYINQEGNVVFLLPVSSSDWDYAGKEAATEKTSRIMCFLWNMISELKLKSQDGNFVVKRGFVVFDSHFNPEDAATLQEFKIKCENSEVSRFILTPLPAELQGAMAYEN